MLAYWAKFLARAAMQHTQIIYNIHKVIITHLYCTLRKLLQLLLDARSGTTKNN